MTQATRRNTCYKIEILLIVFIDDITPKNPKPWYNTALVIGPDGTKQYAKTINNEPDKFFTKDVLSQIDEAAKKEFLYGAE